MTTEQIESELGEHVLALCAEPWRIMPHTFAVQSQLQCPGGAFKRTKLADYLCELIADEVMAGGARVILNVPPRQGKSEVGSFVIPAWYLEHFPQEKVILGTHTASLALDFGRRIRNEFANNDNLTTELQDDAQAANQWNTSEGGGLKTIGVGGALFGFGGNLIIVDDPHKGWIEAQSPTERRNVVGWFDGTLMNRLEPGASVLIIMHRLHRDDLTGHCKKNSKENWKIVRLPALAEPGDPMGRAIGEAVCPERYGTEEMTRIVTATARSISAAMYDQNPEASTEGHTYSSYGVENVKSVALDPSLDLFVTFDFNVNPGMHALIGQSNTLTDRIIFRHEIFGERMKTPACAKAVADKLKSEGLADKKLIIYGDRSGKTENTQTAQTDYALIGKTLRENGVANFEFHVPEANPPIKARVGAMNEALCDGSGARHLFVHSDCKRFIADLENVEDGDDGLPDKGDSDLTHASDAAGYAVAKIRPIIKRKITGGNAFAPPPRK